ncbi:hypothetical protein CsSME_00023612 [Camellia sinensis var. sinensis]
MLSLAANDFNFTVLSLSQTLRFEFKIERGVSMLCFTKWLWGLYMRFSSVIVAMDPSPADPTDDVDSVILTCRYREATIVRMGRPDARIVPYLQRAGFCRLIHVPFIQLGWHLIVVIVERWRSETHTFHLTSGEVTITLQDVNILSGLRVDGNAVSGNTGYDWPVICNRLLGTVPPTNQLKGSRLNMTWLSQTCGNLPIDVDDVIVQRYARAFILQLLGGSIFAGKSGNMVQLIAALAWLYREYVVHLANVCMTFLIFSSLFKFGRGIDFPTLLRVIFLDNQ